MITNISVPGSGHLPGDVVAITQQSRRQDLCVSATFASMQAKPEVSVDALTSVLADLIAHLKRLGEGPAIQFAAGLDLSFSQLCSLFILDSSDHALAVHELAERLGLSVAAAGRAVDALVRAGMVRRREDEHDRRVKRVTLAEPGNRLIARLTAAQTEGLRTFAGLLTDEERANLHAALAPILARPELRTHTVKETG
jgi:DNA-binding MarR family transcriptional regulator